jgi:VCBS repeat-containing protein
MNTSNKITPKFPFLPEIMNAFMNQSYTYLKAKTSVIVSLKHLVLMVAVVFSASATILSAQTLTISDAGETGTSGTGWSTTGTNPVIITAISNATVNTSLIEGYLNAGTNVLLESAVVNLSNQLDKTAGGDATLTLRAGGDNLAGLGRAIINASIQSTSGALNIVLWSDYNNHNIGGATISGTPTINTNGGHFWMGGSATTIGSTTWNGLTVGDGPSVGSSSANWDALGLFNTTISTNGGDAFLWAGQGHAGGVSGIGLQSTSSINTGSGDIILAADVINNGSLTLTSTGHLYLAPHDGAYPSALTWSHNGGAPNINVSGTFDALNINAFSSLGGLTIGEYDGMTGITFSNTSNITMNTSTTIAGPIAFIGNHIIIDESLETTASNADILVKSFGAGSTFNNGYLVVETSDNLTTNGGDIILWANAANRSSGSANNEIVLKGSNTLSTSGGKIVLAGGLDDGGNGGTASDGIPDGYAYRGGAVGGAISLGANTKLLSAGGDVIIKGQHTNEDGILGAGSGLIIDSGSGTITMHGKSVSNHGINLQQGNFVITSSSTVDTAISIEGETQDSGNNSGLLFSYTNTAVSSLIQTTGASGGGILLEGNNSSGLSGFGIWFGITSGFAGNTQILSNTGDITLASTSRIYTDNQSVYLGNRKDATAVNGITPLSTTASGAITFTTDTFVFSTNYSNTISTSGALTIEPNSNAFSSAFNWNGTLSDLDSDGVSDDWLGSTAAASTLKNFRILNVASLSGLTIGKAANTANVTFGSATTIAGPISVYGGDITANENLTSTAANEHILLKGTGNITLAASKTLQTNGGGLIVWSDSDGSNDGRVDLYGNVTTNSGHFYVGGGSASETINGLTVPASYAITTVANTHGVRVSGSAINTSGGDLRIKGQNNSVNTVTAGVMVANSAITTAAGDLELFGKRVGDPSESSGLWIGTTISGPLTPTGDVTLSSTTGNINLEGISEASNGFTWSHGLAIVAHNGDDVTISSTSGNIELLGNASNAALQSGEALGLVIQLRGGVNSFASLTTDGGTITLEGISANLANKQGLVLRPKDVANSIVIGDANTGDITFKTGSLQNTSTTTLGAINIESIGDVVFEGPTGSNFASAIDLTDEYNIVSSATSLRIGKPTNTANITLSANATIAGPITVYGGDIAINENLNTSSVTNGDVLLKASGSIIQAADRSITTDSGAIIFWSDSDANTDGYINIGNNGSLNSANGFTDSGLSGGGNITLAGGADDGANGGTASDGIPDGFARSASNPGIELNTDNTGDVSFYSGGGNVIMLGYSSNNESPTVTNNAGINQFGGLLVNAGTGRIRMIGEGVNNYGMNLNQASAAAALKLELISAATTGDAIFMRGVSGNDLGLVFNFSSNKQLKATAGGNITLEGVGGGASQGIFLQTIDVLATTGAITLDGGTNGIFNKNTANNYGFKAGTAITASSSDIIFKGNAISFEAGGTGTTFSTTGAVTLEPSGASFTSALTYPITNLSLNSGVTGLTLGKATNTAGITIGSATTIVGPISVYGGSLALNGALAATSNTISLTASTAATQSAALTASNLELSGAGSFTLTNTANNVGTIAGGTGAAKLGSLNYVDSNALTIGEITNAGIVSTGKIVVETLADDLTLSRNIATDNTDADAIVLNAGKTTAIGTITGGDIIVSGTPTVTTGANGIARLFSGSTANSTGLSTLIGGAVNERFSVDETSGAFVPVLAAGNNYALFRGANVNVGPSIATNTGITIVEGATGVITTAMLNEGDPDDSGAGLTYSVTTLPANGAVQLNSANLALNGTFTQADIDAGNVQYVHDGSENSAESFGFSLADGGENGVSAVTAQSFAITVTPVNDAPTLASNTGITLAEGATGTITTAMLNEGDPDDTGVGLTYTVTTLAENGVLTLESSTGVSTNLALNGTFTQADIDSGLVSYTHNGTETTADSFGFSLADGGEDGVAAVTGQSFAITLTAVNEAPTIAVNTGISINEDDTFVLTAAELSATDSDDTAAGIIYSLTTLPTGGKLQLNGADVALNGTFTQADIDNGNVQYAHTGELASDNFGFSLADGGENGVGALTDQVFTIAVTLTNDSPAIGVNLGLAVNEGDTTTITTAMLNEGDPDDDGAGITYTVTAIPANGTLTRRSTAIALNGTFTQADIDNGEVQYAHDGTETTADSFGFSLADGGENGAVAVTGQSFAIAISLVNEAPVVSINTGISVTEGDSTIINSASLQALDVDDDTTGYYFTLDALPNNGQLKLRQQPLSVGSTFTQADIDSSRISYVHDGTEAATDSVLFSVKDGGENGATALVNQVFTFSITAVNDQLSLAVNTGINLDEGATKTIEATNLAVSDFDDSGTGIVYTLKLAPSHGLLQKKGVTLALNGTFTQADIDSNQIVYANNAGESIVDSFSFDVADGGEDGTTAITNTAFAIAINPINDAPSMKINAGLSLLEADSMLITPAKLEAIDRDDVGAGLVYTITSLPVNGLVKNRGNTLALNGQFTQNDLESNRVQYVHNGSETTADSFEFTLADGGENDVEAVDGQVFDIVISLVNDAPSLAVNAGVTVAEADTVAITKTELNEGDGDDSGQGLTYTVTTLPVNGALTFESSAGVLTNLGLNAIFTQADIDSGLVSYIHDGSETTADSFGFSLSDGGEDGVEALTGQLFNVSVTAVNEAPVITVNTGASIAEADTVVFSTALLQSTDPDDDAAGLSYTLTTLPQNGVLTLELSTGVWTTLALNGTFTQSQIDSNLVRYVHDANENTADSLGFSLADGGEDGIQAITDQVFVFAITPVNDAPVVAINLGASVIEADSVLIGATQLSLQDADDDSTGITYTVTSLPANGTLTLESSTGESTTLALNGTFTQADIDNALLSYVHAGGENLADSLGFSFIDGGEDGVGAVVDQVFAFTVTAVNDAPVVAINTGMSLAEGATSIVTAAMLNEGVPDDDGEGLSYTVTSLPENGVLTLGSTTLELNGSFTQADIDNGDVQYVHDGSETSADSFGFSLDDGGEDEAAAVQNQDFNIAVTAVNNAPIVAINTGMTVAEGATAAITTAMLNEGDTDDEGEGLTYTVTTLPENGVLRLASSTLGSTTLALNGTFTQADIDNGDVQYVHNGGETSTDNFDFSLADGGEDGVAALTGQRFAITVSRVNDSPTIIFNTGATVQENGTVTLGSIQLNEGDPDDGGAGLTYTVTSLPANGTLTLESSTGESTTLALNGTFNQADIDAGRVQYAHLGGEIASDSFGFSLADGGEDGAVALTGQSFAITITAVNDAPAIAINTGLSLAEGAAATITNSMLNEGDPDDSGAGLTYTLTTLPANGAIQLNSANLALNGTFTQADIDNNLVSYIHNGSETTADSFGFSLADGGENGVSDVSGQQFAIGVNPVNDAPRFVNLNSISIQENEILVTTLIAEDEENNELTFNLIGGEDASLFSLDNSTNELTFNEAADFEFKTSYEVIVQVSDGNSLTDLTITISLIDIDEETDSDGDGVPNYFEELEGTDPNNKDDYKDTDGDGSSDFQETKDGTDPTNAADVKDSDGDGVPDDQELRDGTDPNDSSSFKDTDGDGSSDFQETKDGTDPTNPSDAKDSDGDGVPDDQELRDGTDPNDSSSFKDTDGDGSSDFQETKDGSDPTNPSDAKDSDGDGVPDDQELRDGTDPNDPTSFKDTDGDGVPDYIENREGTDQNDSSRYKDLDGDGVPDYEEERDGTDPNDKEDFKDTDGDSSSDYNERRDSTNPRDPRDAKDSDEDGVPDDQERREGTDPNNPNDAIDSDGDGIPDDQELRDGTNPNDASDAPDTDGDGVSDANELKDGTDENDPNDFKDSDGDGVPDFTERAGGTNPFDGNDFIDSDGDGVPDYTENNEGTDPNNPADALDSDGDEVPDYIERRIGTDINDANSFSDTDGDLVPDFIEINEGTSPTNTNAFLDTDGDGVPDYVERADGTNVADASSYLDSDGDEVPDYVEQLNDETDANDGTRFKDSDGDQIPDYVELREGTDSLDASSFLDTDGDGSPDYKERLAGTDPTLATSYPDQDGDEVPDYVEFLVGTNLLDGLDYIDSDGDRVPDYIELLEGTDPNDASSALDSDGDGVLDYIERRDGTDQNDRFDYKDSDGDLVPDDVEILIDFTDPNDQNDFKDSDGDFVPDYIETRENTDINDSDDYSDRDEDEVPDYSEIIANSDPDDPNSYSDADGDGVPDYTEIIEGTDPNDSNSIKDTDGDLVPDYFERINGTGFNDPVSFLDTDNDEVPDYVEGRAGSDANEEFNFPDSDGDTVPDYVELLVEGTDPNDPNDFLDTDGDGASDYFERHDRNAPFVQFTFPKQDSVGVDFASDFEFSLSEPIIVETGYIYIIRARDGLAVDSVAIGEDRVKVVNQQQVLLNNLRNLDEGTTYLVSVPPTLIRDRSDNSFTAAAKLSAEVGALMNSYKSMAQLSAPKDLSTLKTLYRFTTKDRTPPNLLVELSQLADDNSYVDISFSELVYGKISADQNVSVRSDSSHVRALSVEDFEAAIATAAAKLSGNNQGVNGATTVQILGLSQPDSENLAEATPLEIGSERVRVFLAYDSKPNGLEQLSLSAAGINSIIDFQANGVAVTQGFVTKLVDQVAPQLVDASGNPLADAIVLTQPENQQTAYTFANISEPLSWRIVPSPDSALFMVDSTSNTLRFKQAPDFESPADAGGVNSYNVALIASDSLNNQTRIAFNITVEDIDEIKPVISGIANAVGDSAQVLTVENTFSVAVFTANETVSWSLNGADSDKFSITQDGVVDFRMAPDFEEPADTDRDNSYALEVIATDLAQNSSSFSLRVTVQDVDEIAPEARFTEPIVSEQNGNIGLVYTINLSEKPQVFEASNLSVNGASIANFTQQNDSTYTVELAVTGRKATLQIQAGVFQDLAGNDNLASEEINYAQLGLYQSYPNPFNQSATIEFGLNEKQVVRIQVYNILGQKVATLADGEFDEGLHQVQLHGFNLASGVYLYRMSTNNGFQQTMKMMFIR